MNDKLRKILFWIVVGTLGSSMIGIWVYSWMNDELTQMQIFKQIWWWYLPLAAIGYYLIIKLVD
jgi:uncharacterized membrane protein